MTRQEHLLTIAAEECAEVAQRCAKAQRFGLQQVQQDADDRPEENPDRLSNRLRIRQELIDLLAVLDMIDPNIIVFDRSDFASKVERVERYLLRSQRCGTLTEVLAHG